MGNTLQRYPHIFITADFKAASFSSKSVIRNQFGNIPYSLHLLSPKRYAVPLCKARVKEEKQIHLKIALKYSRKSFLFLEKLKLM